MTWNNDTKHSSTWANATKGGEGLTWNQATFTWNDRPDATWDNPTLTWVNDTKHSTLFANATKH